MLSIITTGRDDDYGYGFLDRLHKSIEHNCKLFKENNLDFEYIICEWNPLKKYLSENDKFKDLFSSYNLKNIIIDKSVVVKERLGINTFYEYFAKNCGARNSKHDNLLFLNSDILLKEDSCNKICNLIKENNIDSRKFYRLKFRSEVNLNNIMQEFNLLNLHIPANSDSIICGSYSGDFLLINRKTFFEVGTGYDETNIFHRSNNSQCGMDGEILWNLHNRGVTIELIPLGYVHINHGRSNPYDGHYNMNGYINKENWGFVDYKRKDISNSCTIIYNEE